MICATAEPEKSNTVVSAARIDIWREEGGGEAWEKQQGTRVPEAWWWCGL